MKHNTRHATIGRAYTNRQQDLWNRRYKPAAISLEITISNIETQQKIMRERYQERLERSIELFDEYIRAMASKMKSSMNDYT